MADRQALKATFFAFRKRERGGVLLRATVAFGVMALVLMAAFIAVFWGSLGPVIQWYIQIIEASATNDTAAIEAAGFPTEFFGFIGGLLLWLFPFYILFAAYEAACLRWMIHGETSGFMGLSLGAPTWRVWSVYWIWFALNIAFTIVMSIVMGVMMGAMMVSTGGDPSATATAIPVVYVLQYGLMAYFAVRFAPAAATTIARRKFAFFDSWTVTKGRFLALLGSFVLLYLIYIVASLALGAIWFATVLGSGAPDIAAAAGDTQRMTLAITETLEAYLQSLADPSTWAVIGVLQVVGLIVAVLLYVAMYGVNARAAMVALEEGKIKPAAD